MITRRQLTLTTPNTLILGIAHRDGRTAITGGVRLRNGELENDAIEMVGGDLWETLNEGLADVRIIRAPYLLLLTTCGELNEWLHKPIKVEQPETKTVWVGRERFTVKTGGNEHQWAILRHLFIYTWRCDRVPALKKAEGLLQ
jgi:hypothetical protein